MVAIELSYEEVKQALENYIQDVYIKQDVESFDWEDPRTTRSIGNSVEAFSMKAVINIDWEDSPEQT